MNSPGDRHPDRHRLHEHACSRRRSCRTTTRSTSRSAGRAPRPERDEQPALTPRQTRRAPSRCRTSASGTSTRAGERTPVERDRQRGNAPVVRRADQHGRGRDRGHPDHEPHDVPSLHAPDYGAPVTRTTVFGAGAMGTAVAMHAARQGHDVALWGSSHDSWAFQHLLADRKHPLLPEHLPDAVRLYGPDELATAAADAQFLVLGANSHGARSLAQADPCARGRRRRGDQRRQGPRARHRASA